MIRLWHHHSAALLTRLSEYLRREDQILSLRVLQDERRNREKDAMREQGNEGADMDATMDLDEEANLEDLGATGDQAVSGSKVVVIHPGSQNLRIGLASDALPKTVPMVIARKWKQNESEEDAEPRPKRVKLDDGSYADPPKTFGDEVRDIPPHYIGCCLPSTVPTELQGHVQGAARAHEGQ